MAQPEVRRSTDGVLVTTLETAIATNSFVDAATGLDKTVETPTYEGQLTGPTLRLEPGDRLQIDIVNSFLPTRSNPAAEHSRTILTRRICIPMV